MATRSTEAIVEPRFLKWARQSAGLSPEEAARALQTKDEKVLAWEGRRRAASLSRRLARTASRMANRITV
jgi:DNA-binding transcriptional regulator YiaG